MLLLLRLLSHLHLLSSLYKPKLLLLLCEGLLQLRNYGRCIFCGVLVLLRRSTMPLLLRSTWMRGKGEGRRLLNAMLLRLTGLLLRRSFVLSVLW